MIRILLSVFLLYVPQTQQQSLNQVLSSNWKFRLAGNQTWYPASVPSTVHLDLLDNNLIEDPYFRSNLLNTYWIEVKDWDYQSNFDVSDEQMLNQQVVELVFQGLDTHADIFLNYQLILSTNNMFRTWQVDVKKYLKKTQNLLLVKFYSSANYDVRAAAKLKADSGIVLPYNYSFTRKAAYQYGWDWGPRLLTVGIWKNITLRGYSNVLLNNIHIRTLQISEKVAKMQLKVETTIVNPQGKYFVDASLPELSLVVAESVQLQQNSLIISFEIPNPQLWWVRNIKPAHLYSLNLVIKDAQNKVLQEKDQTFGVRIVKWVQENDEKGVTFKVNLNGVDVFMKGGNYIPPDMFMPRAQNPSVYQKTIQDAVDANYNMLRVWGGGQFENDIFYDLCDQNGLLIWHDLMFACAMYPASTEILDNIKQEMLDNVKRLRNHPSIGMWNGNNEVWIGWQEWGWKQDLTLEQREIVEKWYNQIFLEVIAGVLDDEDPDNYYWPTSPSQSVATNATINQGDIHYWNVWAGKADIEDYNLFVGRFNSEYGMQGILEMSSIKRFTIPSDWDETSQTMELHERHVVGWPTINYYLNEYYKPVKDFQTKVYVSQIMQSYAVKTAIEALRRGKPFCMGSLYWQLNDVWPVISWASVDFYGQWKASHYVAREMYKEVLISVNQNEVDKKYEIFIVNDKLQPVQGRFQVKLFHQKKNAWEQLSRLTIPANSNQIVLNLDYSLVKDTKNQFLHMRFETDQHETFEQTHFFVRPLEFNLQNPQFNIFLNFQSNSVTVYAHSLVRGFYIFRSDLEPLKLDNNYFDLVPGQKKKVYFLGDQLLDVYTKLEYFSLFNSYIHEN